MVDVFYGSAEATGLSLDGQTVAQVRSLLTEALRIPGASDAPAQINGRLASESDVVPAGATIDFVKATAQKG